jgi:hypothetical protein
MLAWNGFIVPRTSIGLGRKYRMRDAGAEAYALDSAQVGLVRAGRLRLVAQESKHQSFRLARSGQAQAAVEHLVNEA